MNLIKSKNNKNHLIYTTLMIDHWAAPTHEGKLDY